MATEANRILAKSAEYKRVFKARSLLVARGFITAKTGNGFNFFLVVARVAMVA